MAEPRRFSYLAVNGANRPADFAPYLPLTLSRNGISVDVSGLVDSGASVNVLPYRIGLELGAVWEQQTIDFELGGNLASYKPKHYYWSPKSPVFRQLIWHSAGRKRKTCR
ncbi:MAG: hypothetical protein LH472_10715 [Pyrinomonadaceae bacterium]|nr:hypothetical protein [Pyrinomonadaceae bacterium]